MNSPIRDQPIQLSCGSYLSIFAPVEQGSDFFQNLERCRDDGEKRMLFMGVAQRPDVPLRAVGEILTYRDQLLVTLALQSLSSIEDQVVRQKLSNLELIEGLDPSPSEIYDLPNPDDYEPWSVLVLHKLCEQAESGSDLTRISAAWTIEQLGYPQAYTGKLLHQPVRKIQEQILHDNLQRLHDSRFLSDSIRYREYIEFWTFAPIPILMELISQPQAMKVSRDVLERLGMFGINLVVAYAPCLDEAIIMFCLDIADSIIKDKRYSNAKTQDLLAITLLLLLEDRRVDVAYLTAKVLTGLLDHLSPDEKAIVECLEFDVPRFSENTSHMKQSDLKLAFQEYQHIKEELEQRYRNAFAEAEKADYLNPGETRRNIEDIHSIRKKKVLSILKNIEDSLERFLHAQAILKSNIELVERVYKDILGHLDSPSIAKIVENSHSYRSIVYFSPLTNISDYAIRVENLHSYSECCTIYGEIKGTLLSPLTNDLSTIRSLLESNKPKISNTFNFNIIGLIFLSCLAFIAYLVFYVWVGVTVNNLLGAIMNRSQRELLSQFLVAAIPVATAAITLYLHFSARKKIKDVIKQIKISESGLHAEWRELEINK